MSTPRETQLAFLDAFLATSASNFEQMAKARNKRHKHLTKGELQFAADELRRIRQEWRDRVAAETFAPENEVTP